MTMSNAWPRTRKALGLGFREARSLGLVGGLLCAIILLLIGPFLFLYTLGTRGREQEDHAAD